MMKIDHIAIWTNNLDELRSFYVTYFKASSNEKYYNATKRFSSYFLSFAEGCKIEIIEMPGIPNSENNGFQVVGEPRTTGDGCYESGILDPDKNRIEIIA